MPQANALISRGPCSLTCISHAASCSACRCLPIETNCWRRLIDAFQLVACLTDLLKVTLLGEGKRLRLLDEQKRRLPRREAACAGCRGGALGAAGATSRRGRTRPPIRNQGTQSCWRPLLATDLQFTGYLRSVLASGAPSLAP